MRRTIFRFFLKLFLIVWVVFVSVTLFIEMTVPASEFVSIVDVPIKPFFYSIGWNIFAMLFTFFLAQIYLAIEIITKNTIEYEEMQEREERKRKYEEAQKREEEKKRQRELILQQEEEEFEHERMLKHWETESKMLKMRERFREMDEFGCWDGFEIHLK